MDRVRELLETKTVSPDEKKNGESCLHVAVETGDVEIARLLLQHGAEHTIELL